jgi:hypothetical protein
MNNEQFKQRASFNFEYEVFGNIFSFAVYTTDIYRPRLVEWLKNYRTRPKKRENKTGEPPEFVSWTRFILQTSLGTGLDLKNICELRYFNKFLG